MIEVAAAKQFEAAMEGHSVQYTEEEIEFNRNLFLNKPYEYPYLYMRGNDPENPRKKKFKNPKKKMTLVTSAMDTKDLGCFVLHWLINYRVLSSEREEYPSANLRDILKKHNIQIPQDVEDEIKKLRNCIEESVYYDEEFNGSYHGFYDSHNPDVYAEQTVLFDWMISRIQKSFYWEQSRSDQGYDFPEEYIRESMLMFAELYRDFYWLPKIL